MAISMSLNQVVDAFQILEKQDLLQRIKECQKQVGFDFTDGEQ
jgi:hypothetical protein